MHDQGVQGPSVLVSGCLVQGHSCHLAASLVIRGLTASVICRPVSAGEPTEGGGKCLVPDNTQFIVEPYARRFHSQYYVSDQHTGCYRNRLAFRKYYEIICSLVFKIVISL